MAGIFKKNNKKEFEEVIDCLQEVRFLPSYGFRVKSLEMRSSVELVIKSNQGFDYLSYKLNAFDQFIRRNKRITQTRKSSYLNLIKFTRRMLNTKMNPNSNTLQWKQLHHEIEEEKHIAVKYWLLEKLEVLKK